MNISRKYTNGQSYLLERVSLGTSAKALPMVASVASSEIDKCRHTALDAVSSFYSDTFGLNPRLGTYVFCGSYPLHKKATIYLKYHVK